MIKINVFIIIVLVVTAFITGYIIPRKAHKKIKKRLAELEKEPTYSQAEINRLHKAIEELSVK